MTGQAATLRAEPASGDRFARVCARLGFDDPDLFGQRRSAVLSAFGAATSLAPSQLRTIVRAQQPRVTVREPDRTVILDGQLRAALGCLREEARLHGRLVAVGQAWAGCNQLVALIVRRPVVSEIVASAVAGEVLCRLLDDLHEHRVLSHDDEDLLRYAWRQAHPAPAYFRHRS